MPTAFTVHLSSDGYNDYLEQLEAKQIGEISSNISSGTSKKDCSELRIIREAPNQEIKATKEVLSEENPIPVPQNVVDVNLNALNTAGNHLKNVTGPHRLGGREQEEASLDYTSSRALSDRSKERDFSTYATNPSNNLQRRTMLESSVLNNNDKSFTNCSPHPAADDSSLMVHASSILNNMKQVSTAEESTTTSSLPSTGRFLENTHRISIDNTSAGTASATSTINHKEYSKMQGLQYEHELAMRERMAAYNRLQSRMSHDTNEQEENNNNNNNNSNKPCSIRHNNNGNSNPSDVHRVNTNDFVANQPYLRPFSSYSLHPTILSQMNYKPVVVPNRLDYSTSVSGYLPPNVNQQQHLLQQRLHFPNNDIITSSDPYLHRYSNLQQKYVYGPFSEGSNDLAQERFVNPQVGQSYNSVENRMCSINDNHMGFVMQRPNSFSTDRHHGVNNTLPTSEHTESLSNIMQQTSQNSHLSLLLQQHQERQQQLLQYTRDLERHDQDLKHPFSLRTMDQSMPTIDQDCSSDDLDCFEGIRRSGQLSGLQHRYYDPFSRAEKGRDVRSIKSTETSSLATSSLISYPVRMLDSTCYQGSPKQWAVKSHTSSKTSRRSTHRPVLSLKDLNSSPCYKAPMNLGAEADREHLSKFLQYLRAECCEVFTASEDDVFHRRKSKQIRLHQVGIRCALCASKPYSERTLRSSCYPSSFDRIYQSVTMMIRDHFSDCPHFSEDKRTKYDTIKASSVRKGNYEAKSYWIKSAQQLGIVETDEGLFFLKK